MRVYIVMMITRMIAFLVVRGDRGKEGDRGEGLNYPLAEHVKWVRVSLPGPLWPFVDLRTRIDI